MCFAEKDALFSSGLIIDYKKLDHINLNDISFEYNCLDIIEKGEIYNVLVDFDYHIENGEVSLEYHSIFIDSGDVDMSEALKKRGIGDE